MLNNDLIYYVFLRLGKMVVASNKNGAPITADDLVSFYIIFYSFCFVFKHLYLHFVLICTLFLYAPCFYMHLVFICTLFFKWTSLQAKVVTSFTHIFHPHCEHTLLSELDIKPKIKKYPSHIIQNIFNSFCI